MPHEIDHFLEIRKHINNGTYTRSSSLSRSSFDSTTSGGTDSIMSRSSFDCIPTSEIKPINIHEPNLTNNINHNNNNNNNLSLNDSKFSNTTSKTIFSPMSLTAYLLIIITWIGTIIWIIIKGSFLL